MASFKTIIAGTVDELIRELNGFIRGGRDITSQGRDVRPNPDTTAGHNLYKHPVAGLTLVFSTPAATVTFSADLDWKGILDEINTQVGADVAYVLSTDGPGRILALWDDTTPVVLSHTGTANTYFGFSTTSGDARLTQTKYVNTDIFSVSPDLLSKQWVAVIYK